MIKHIKEMLKLKLKIKNLMIGRVNIGKFQAS